MRGTVFVASKERNGAWHGFRGSQNNRAMHRFLSVSPRAIISVVLRGLTADNRSGTVEDVTADEPNEFISQPNSFKPQAG